MFSDGPAFMELNKLESELSKIKEHYLGERDNEFKPFVKPSNYEDNKKFIEEHKRNCNKFHIGDDKPRTASDIMKLSEEQIKREELERLGIPYKIVRDEEEDTKADNHDSKE